MAAYAVAKTGVVVLTMTMAVEGAPDGITVNAVEAMIGPQKNTSSTTKLLKPVGIVSTWGSELNTTA